jgi:hypothetical protein
MISWALLIATTADTECEMAGPLQGGNGPLGVVGDPHRLTTSSALGTQGSQHLFRRRRSATSFSCHRFVTFKQRLSGVSLSLPKCYQVLVQSFPTAAMFCPSEKELFFAKKKVRGDREILRRFGEENKCACFLTTESPG